VGPPASGNWIAKAIMNHPMAITWIILAVRRTLNVRAVQVRICLCMI
tara:strand:- start:37847 stop:37987 length:141 start_codon:yes stop_codon:yes gene_type:complete